MRVRTIEVEGVRLRVVEAGSGDALMVLHGFTGSAESMACVSDGLRDRHRVVRLELIGHGGRDAPKDVAPYAMDACARQIVGIAHALDLERPDLLGYSMGGRAALAAAVASPEVFGRLVLVGATAGIEDPAARRARIEADERLAERIEVDGLEAFVDAWMALPLFASQARLGVAARTRAREQRLRNDERGLANSLRGMGAGAQTPLHDRLARIAQPVLLVVGGEDRKFREIAADLEKRLPDARTRVVDGVGHAVHLEAPGAFARLVSDFLAREVA
jgi:2-succinyl-6-hydroxy-2,4-cyclohexadiene-1-carboxylate synthase